MEWVAIVVPVHKALGACGNWATPCPTGVPCQENLSAYPKTVSYGGCELWLLPATHIPVLGSPCHHLSCCKFGVFGCCLLAGSSRLVPHTARPMSLSLLSC